MQSNWRLKTLHGEQITSRSCARSFVRSFITHEPLHVLDRAHHRRRSGRVENRMCAVKQYSSSLSFRTQARNKAK